MSEKIQNLMDRVISEGNLNTKELIEIAKKVSQNKTISNREIAKICEDLKSIRYLFTIEKTVKNIIMYLTRHKSSTAAELMDYKRVQTLLKFLINETSELLSYEEEEKNSKKPKQTG